MKDQTADFGIGALKVLPSVGAIWLVLTGWTVEKWAALAGLCFILLQSAYLLWRWRREAKGRRMRRRG